MVGREERATAPTGMGAVLTAAASSRAGASKVRAHLGHLTFLPAAIGLADLSVARHCGHVTENAMTPPQSRTAASLEVRARGE